MNRRFAAVLMSALAACVLAGRASAQTFPRFERGPCGFEVGAWARHVQLECGTLFVPQDRTRPDRKSLHLAVAILRAKQPASVPLVLLHGGPGGRGGVQSLTRRAAEWAVARTRDIIVLDVRGAGLSEPALCPDFIDAGGRALALRPPARRHEAFASAVRACIASLQSQGIDPAAYNTPINAADLKDLRRVLRIPSWDLMGLSYGAGLARQAMRDDPTGIRSVVLESPPVPDISAGDRALLVQRLVDRIFGACTAQPACAEAFPSLEKDFMEVFDELKRTPLEIATPAGPVLFDAERFMIGLEFTPVSTQRLPMIVRELRRGDRARAARMLVGDGRVNPYFPLGHLVECGSSEATRENSIRGELKEPFHVLADDERGQCDYWLPRRRVSLAPSARSAIPTLIMMAQFDFRTPLAGERLAPALDHAYVYTMPGETHEEWMPTPCHASIVSQFLVNPSRAPDATCIEAVPPLVFEPNAVASPNVTFAIAAAGEVKNVFAGRWTGEVVGLGRMITFDLKIDGSRVTGTVTAGPDKWEIDDGSIDASTMTVATKSPDGQRRIVFTGTVRGDEIEFVREIIVPAGAPSGVGLFGVSGPRGFTARREGA
jgi:pimeloyl-ACP methyl ester carboxylesterase